LLGEALATFKSAAEETLTISTTPTFAANWLAGRIGKFQLAAPHIAVRMIANVDLADFARDSIDVAIRYGTAGQRGLVFHELIRIDYTPMLSPRLLDSAGPLKGPRDLLGLRLIDPDDPWWRHWFEAAGVHDATSRDGPAFGSVRRPSRRARRSLDTASPSSPRRSIAARSRRAAGAAVSASLQRRQDCLLADLS